MSRQLDLQLWQQFWSLAKPYWFSRRWGAIALLGLLVFLSVIGAGLLVLVSILLGEVTSALAEPNLGRFWQTLSIFLGVIVLGVLLLSLKSYVQAKVALNWRRWLTHQFLEQYFERRTFYRLSFYPEIDNSDQRLADDIKTFTFQAVNFLSILLDSLLQLVGFIGFLWFISKPLTFFLVVYAVAGTAVTTVFFGRILIGINHEQLKYEADFRFGLSRVRENAEAIAFDRGQEAKSDQVQHRFWQVLNKFNRLIRWQLNLNLFQNGYQYITFVLPALILAPRSLSGELEVGAFVKAGTAFRSILIALTLIVTQFEELRNFAAGVDRLASFAAFTQQPPQTPAQAPPLMLSRTTT